MHHHLPKSINEANARLIKKMKNLLLITYIFALIVVILEQAGLLPDAIPTLLRSLVPSLLAAPQGTQYAFIVFFGLTALLSPLTVAYLMTNDPLHERFLHSINDRGAVSPRRIFFVYCIGLPVIVFMLYLCLNSSSFSYAPERSLSGAMLVQTLTQSPVALLLMAPLVSLGLWLLLYIVLVLLIGPLKKSTEN